MVLPVAPPLKPMLASAVRSIPRSGGYLFEPKWDGFRCLVFRDGADITLQSRSGKPLQRYFPEMVAQLQAALPDHIALDGELVIGIDGRLDFDALSERIHPARSRVEALAEATPADFIAFDLLAFGSDSLLELPTAQRRAALCATDFTGARVHRTPATTDPALAEEWFTLFEGAGLDGVIGKPGGQAYQPGKRSMIKIKHQRSADCVLAGLRWHVDAPDGGAVGSLLLGLYDAQARLHHVGVVGSFPMARRVELAEELRGLIIGPQEQHPWLGTQAQDGRRLPGSVNRWRSGEQPWVPLCPSRVLEVTYEHTEGAYPARFRHTARFLRWRADRDPSSCGYAQLDEPLRYDLDSVLRGEVRQARG